VSRSGDNHRSRVAVVGAGVSGLTAAYLLARTSAVTVYESESRLGGHAHTHDIDDPSGRTLAVDTGFIVHNDRTYPQLLRLFAEVGVATRATEMSMSIRDEATGLEYAGGRGLKGIFAQPARALDPRFLAVLRQVKRFHLRAHAFLDGTDDADLTTFGDFLDAERFTEAFVDLYARPLVSCVWSTGSASSMGYPARYLFRFLAHHGMLTVTGSPRWFTVVGGSRTYVDAVAARLPDVRAGVPVSTVLRDADGVTVVDGSGRSDRFDRVVLAVHADQALAMLGDPGDDEKQVLGAFGYSRNETILHTDVRILPRARQARASWNYLTPTAADAASDRAPVVTYWMNRLQGLKTDEQYLVTLNARPRIDPQRILAVMEYEHPVYDLPAVAAQSRLASLTTVSDRVRRCLSRLGVPRGRLPLRRRGCRGVRGDLVTSLSSSLPALPSLVVGSVGHHRSGPVRHTFRHRVYSWLVDIDDLPVYRWYLKPFTRFDARDHLGGSATSTSLRSNVERFLAAEGVLLGAGSRVLMLANARVLGHVFDPLSVFWCYRGDGTLECVVAEVHNTYGERHAYLLRPDESGAADADKAFYVSPFNEVSGSYALRFLLAPHEVRVGITLSRDGQTVFGAELEGTPTPATPHAVARRALRTPLMPHRVSALIRAHGVWLWLRRLPLVPRPVHHPQKGV
jgi:predicted NAD/FAD-binding protein/DUF1365 family protein